jgi:threonine/homoserine/homoserine lactone efflux protein
VKAKYQMGDVVNRLFPDEKERRILKIGFVVPFIVAAGGTIFALIKDSVVFLLLSFITGMFLFYLPVDLWLRKANNYVMTHEKRSKK